MNETGKIVIDIFNIVFLSIAILMSVGILSLIVYHRRQYPISTAVLLLCNTYLCFIFTSLYLLNISAYSLHGELNGKILFADWWCYTSTYLGYVEISSIYFSFLLQAIFRLFRIVFSKYQRLQNFRFISGLIIVQWSLAFLLTTPSLILGYFQYIPQIYYCRIPFTNLRGTIIEAFAVYYGPTIVTSIIYVYIIYYIKQKPPSTIQQNRYRADQRDLVVLRRIVTLVSILLFFLIVPAVLWFNYIVTGYLHPLIYHTEWLTISTSLLTLSLVTIKLNPQLRQLVLLLFRQNRRIHPAVIVQQRAVN